MRVHSVIFTAVLAALTALPLSAHHSVRANFDTTNPVTLSGVIAKVNLRNPHTTLELITKDPNGKGTTWVIELAPPGALKRNVNVSSLAVGTTVIVEVWLANNGDKLASAGTLTTSDGKTLISVGNSAGEDWSNQPSAISEYRLGTPR